MTIFLIISAIVAITLIFFYLERMGKKTGSNLAEKTTERTQTPLPAGRYKRRLSFFIPAPKHEKPNFFTWLIFALFSIVTYLLSVGASLIMIFCVFCLIVVGFLALNIPSTPAILMGIGTLIIIYILWRAWDNIEWSERGERMLKGLPPSFFLYFVTWFIGVFFIDVRLQNNTAAGWLLDVNKYLVTFVIIAICILATIVSLFISYRLGFLVIRIEKWQEARKERKRQKEEFENSAKIITIEQDVIVTRGGKKIVQKQRSKNTNGVGLLIGLAVLAALFFLFR